MDNPVRGTASAAARTLATGDAPCERAVRGTWIDVGPSVMLESAFAEGFDEWFDRFTDGVEYNKWVATNNIASYFGEAVSNVMHDHETVKPGVDAAAYVVPGDRLEGAAGIRSHRIIRDCARWRQQYARYLVRRAMLEYTRATRSASGRAMPKVAQHG